MRLRSKMWIQSHFLANACFSGFLFGCTKIEQFGFSPETGVNIGSTIFHQQSYPQAVAVLGAFRQQQKVTRREWGFTESAEANGITLLREEKCSIKVQPKLQRTSEKSAQ